jgi:predicted secreted protein
MMSIKVALFFLSVPLMFGLSLAYGSETVTVNKAFNGREIKVRLGNTIRIELEQAGAAGYTWEIQDLDREHFEVLSVTTPEPTGTGDVVGAPIFKAWLIRTKIKGKSDLRFIHCRPWEGEKKATDTFWLKVRIL